MSHDKIRAAARRRMTATGETYTAARRQAINEHNSTQFTAPVSAEDILAAAEVHQELGPDYSDAVSPRSSTR
jgi:D-alanyl-D-alanine carboxypeptidase